MIQKHAEIQDFRIKHEFSLKLGNYGIKDWNCKNYRTLPQITWNHLKCHLKLFENLLEIIWIPTTNHLKIYLKSLENLLQIIWEFTWNHLKIYLKSIENYLKTAKSYEKSLESSSIKDEMKSKNLIHRYCRFLDHIWILAPKRCIIFQID